MPGKPGRPRSLTVEQISQAALDEGLANFSMPSVARRVGVAHSALYRYVADRQELLAQALELALSDVDWPSDDQPWDSLLRELGDTIWDLCGKFPGLERAVLMAPRPPQIWVDQCREYIVSLQKQGFTIDDASILLDFVSRLALFNAHEMTRIETVHEDAKEVPSELKAFVTNERMTGRGFYERQLHMLLTGAEKFRA